MCFIQYIYMCMYAFPHFILCTVYWIIILALKRRCKDMVIILRLCLCICVSGCLENEEYWQRNWATADYTSIKNKNRLLLKRFGYKVMTFYITHSSRLEKTPRDNYTHLNITTTVSWLLLVKHCIKWNTVEVVLATTLSTGFKHSCQESYFLALPISAVYVICTRVSIYLCRTFHRAQEDLNKTETKMYDLWR